MYKIIDCEQSSDEWFQARLGKLTASNFSKIITAGGAPSKSSDDLVNKAVAELIVGKSEVSFKSDAMARGNELESSALDNLNFIYGYNFKPVGFLLAANMGENGPDDGYGCSPDAIDEENLIGAEIKCPLSHTQVSYLIKNGLPQVYLQQVQGSMLVTGFKKWVFFSHHPDVGNLHIVIDRDDEYIEKMRDAIRACVRKVQFRYEKLKDMGAGNA